MESRNLDGIKELDSVSRILFFDNGFIRHLLAGDFNSLLTIEDSSLRRELLALLLPNPVRVKANRLFRVNNGQWS